MVCPQRGVYEDWRAAKCEVVRTEAGIRLQQLPQMIGWFFLLLASAGAVYQLLAAQLALKFFESRAHSPAPGTGPAVSILKPLHGDEPGLEAALSSVLRQDYPGDIQLILGLHSRADPALAVAERLTAAHPERDIRIVVDPRAHGANGKVANLVNMLPHARHETLVVSDSDISVAPDWLSRVVADLDAPGVGVVTCPYYGAARAGFWSRLAAMGLSYQFLPSVATGLALSMAKPCMGSTIALQKPTLARIGGFERFADTLADDYALGAAVRASGLESRVAPVLVAHGCAEASLGQVFAHELRWARTVRGLDPVGFAGSGLTHAVPLACIAVLLSQGAAASWAALAAALAARAWLIRRMDELAPHIAGAWWLFPLRDILSSAVFASSYFVKVVAWRGVRLRVGFDGGMARG
jgi:ceramide glucosyltransferase